MDNFDNIPRIASRLFGTPLMIEPRKLETIIAVLAPKIKGGQLEIALQEPQRTPSQNAGLQVVNGIAILPIEGTLVQRGAWLGVNSGMTSYEGLRRRLDAALADPDVHGILLDIDSPGGEVAGNFDLADIFAQAGQIKPMWAIANELAASAAYSLASTASRLFLTRTAEVGSIGVRMAHADFSKYDEKMGIVYTSITAGARKNDFNPHYPLSDEALQAGQDAVNQIYDIFVATVAKNRSMKESAVRATEAGVYMGQAAVEAGLADAVSTKESVLEQFAEFLAGNTKTFQPTQKKENSMSTNTATEPTIEQNMTADIQIAVDKALADERARVNTVLESAAKMDMPLDAAAKLVAENLDISKSMARVIDYKAEHDDAKGVVSTHLGLSQEQIEANLPEAERYKAMWERKAEECSDFASLEDFVAYKKGAAKGKSRILSKKA